jgi:DNA-binding MarR family transcriptional regulator
MAEERADMIARIMGTMTEMYQLMAFDRSDPLLTVNLTMPQLKVLLTLAVRGGCSGQELNQVLGVSLATITGIVDRLAAQDLVTRREDPHDRRIRRVELTPAGRDLMDGIITAGANHQRQLLGRLDDEGLRVVERSLELMLNAVKAEQAESPGSQMST